MKFEQFKAGRWQAQYQYKSFEPATINHEWIWEDATTNLLLEKANRALGELNAFSLIVPDIDLFIQMHVIKEAQTSSRIEGTQTGIDEALMSEEQISPEKRDDWREVHNYIDAINISIDELKRLPVSNRLLKQTHAILMRGVRGENKQPGEFRMSQNLLIPLYLVSHGLLAKPSLYLSDFFERNRASYYDALMRVRIANDLIHWVRFFLQGMAETASKGRDIFRQVLNLRTQVEHQILGLGKRAPNARQALNLLYRKPMVTALDLEKNIGITHPTANALVKDLIKLGILQEVTGAERHRLYVFETYLSLFSM